MRARPFFLKALSLIGATQLHACADRVEQSVSTSALGVAVVTLSPQPILEGEWVHEYWSVRGMWTELSGPWAGFTKPLRGDRSRVRSTRTSTRDRTFAVLIEEHRTMTVPARVDVNLATVPGVEPAWDLRVAFASAERAERLPLLKGAVAVGSAVEVGSFLSRLPFEMDEPDSWLAEVKEVGPVETVISLRYETFPKEVGTFRKSTFAGTLTVSSASGRPLQLTGHNSWRTTSPTRTNELSVSVEERDHEVTWTYGRE